MTYRHSGTPSLPFTHLDVLSIKIMIELVDDVWLDGHFFILELRVPSYGGYHGVNRPGNIIAMIIASS